MEPGHLAAGQRPGPQIITPAQVSGYVFQGRVWAQLAGTSSSRPERSTAPSHVHPAPANLGEAHLGLPRGAVAASGSQLLAPTPLTIQNILSSLPQCSR